MHDFESLMRSYVEQVEQALPGFLPPTDTEEASVCEAMHYSLLGGGKRIRGVMVLAFYALLQKNLEPAIPFACSLEMIHAYSLIHDDLPCMDDDDLRRGKPSCHVAFGETTALLAGDALLTLAFETASRENELPAKRRISAIAELAGAAGWSGMIGGQVMDLEHEGKQTSEALLRRMYAKKTGALFRAACRMGCILAGGDSQLLAAADIYAAKVGLAFQIVDDLLDELSTPEVLGKPVGSDSENHKTTFATLYTPEQCQAQVRALADEAKQALIFTGLECGFLCQLADRLSDRRF
ncbi:farnesyl diphosphate synthase [Oscillospiraceae bacterium MB08-C2-2]|nr:farnesyl diphosphate synthase [Oscillospiraceae bacterium MB08-C2-2]